MTFKRNLGRVAASIAFMAVACTVGASAVDLEAAPVGLIVAGLMAPAPILFAIMADVMTSRGYAKHAAYFTYFGIWCSFYIYVYLTADSYIPEIALVAVALISIAAISGYIPLMWTVRFSLRTLLIGMTVVAGALGLIIALAR